MPQWHFPCVMTDLHLTNKVESSRNHIEKPKSQPQISEHIFNPSSDGIRIHRSVKKNPGVSQSPIHCIT